MMSCLTLTLGIVIGLSLVSISASVIDPQIFASPNPIEAAEARGHDPMFNGKTDRCYEIKYVSGLIEAKKLITVTKHGNLYRLALTDEGKAGEKDLGDRASFASLVERMREIKKVFGNKSGSALKKLIYRLFDEEVGRRPMGEVIES